MIVVPKNGRPSRVFDLDTYTKVVQTARKVQPWRQRVTHKTPDPLGAVPGRVLSALRREDLYK